jgi:hypothetical protein
MLGDHAGQYSTGRAIRQLPVWKDEGHLSLDELSKWTRRQFPRVFVCCVGPVL